MCAGGLSNYCEYQDFSSGRTRAIVHRPYDLLSCLPLCCECHSSTPKPRFLSKSVFTKCWEHGITNGVSGCVRRVLLGKIVMFKGLCAKHHAGGWYPNFNPGGRTYFLEYYWRTLQSFPVATNDFQLLPCKVLRILLCKNSQVSRCSLWHILL